MGFLQGTDTYSLTQLYTFSSPPTACVHMHLHQPTVKVRETDIHTHTDAQICRLSNGLATGKTWRAGWREIRAEVREGWKEVQLK